MSFQLPVAEHVGVDDVPWVDNPQYQGTSLRLLRASIADDCYVMAGRLPAGLTVGTHRHLGPVHMFTLSGAWGYREHEFVNRAGSYLFEPAGSVHTLFVPDSNTEVTETLTIVHGRTEYLDAAGSVIAVSDVHATLATYFAACDAAGVPRPAQIVS